jgi:predicted transposase/invertase (TIGR01784 family)
MSRISPRVDIAFKKIFGVEENKDLLISLINSIVSDQDQVSDITLLNPYNAQNFTRDKLSILDIKAKGFDGKLFNIEIQISDEADYDKRALYYWAKLYTEQLEVAEDYSTLSKAIGIHILNFISIPEVDKYHNIFHITEKETGQSYFKDLELHTIELKKFSKDSSEQLPDIISKVKNSLDMWLAFLTRHDLLQSDKLSDNLDNSDLKKALTVLDVMNFSSLERDAYEDHLKWLRIEANTLKKAEAKGVEKGREEGREEGREVGIAIGEARSEIKSIEKIAKRMLKKNTDITFISSVTGLSNDQLLKLKNKL